MWRGAGSVAVDTSVALSIPGVQAVFVATDLADNLDKLMDTTGAPVMGIDLWT
jgi:hypothetical protein